MAAGEECPQTGRRRSPSQHQNPNHAPRSPHGSYINLAFSPVDTPQEELRLQRHRYLPATTTFRVALPRNSFLAGLAPDLLDVPIVSLPRHELSVMPPADVERVPHPGAGLVERNPILRQQAAERVLEGIPANWPHPDLRAGHAHSLSPNGERIGRKAPSAWSARRRLRAAPGQWGPFPPSRALGRVVGLCVQSNVDRRALRRQAHQERCEQLGVGA